MCLRAIVIPFYSLLSGINLLECRRIDGRRLTCLRSFISVAIDVLQMLYHLKGVVISIVNLDSNSKFVIIFTSRRSALSIFRLVIGQDVAVVNDKLRWWGHSSISVSTSCFIAVNLISQELLLRNQGIMSRQRGGCSIHGYSPLLGKGIICRLKAINLTLLLSLLHSLLLLLLLLLLLKMLLKHGYQCRVNVGEGNDLHVLVRVGNIRLML